MTLPEELRVSAEGPLRIVTLNRPEALNATNEALHRALSLVWRELAQDGDARVVILTGAGRAFSAGGDFTFMTRLHAEPDYRERTMQEARAILLEMMRFPLPIIAAVNGPAVGLGASLAVSCDIVLLSDQSHLADPHLAIGLVPGDGGAALWPVLTSMLRAKELLFTGDPIAPELAVQLGLATRVVPHADLMSEARRLGERLARLPAAALRDTKRALQAHVEQAALGPMEMAIQAEMRSMASPEHAEKVQKMLARSRKSARERAYRETSYEADTPLGCVRIRIGQREPLLDVLLAQHRAESWCFITAWNPHSDPQPPATNRARNEVLRSALAALGLPACFPGAGRGEAGDWPAEESLLALGVDRETALRLGRELEQSAVVFGRRGEVAELLDCESRS